jgi:hypothetical protein
MHMAIVADSYMRIILPEDISTRIAEFMAGMRNFPFIRDNELICVFYLYGRNSKVNGEEEMKEVIDLAERTVANLSRDIEIYNNSPKAKMNSEFTRSKYINRGLQITIERKADIVKEEQIMNDPAIQSDCFVQHMSYYNQEYFFHIYGPFRDSEVISNIRKHLVGRMVMLGYNRKDEKLLPFHHPLVPLYIWLRDHHIALKS